MKTKFSAVTYKDFLEELQQTDETKLSQLIDSCVDDYKQYLLGMFDGDTYQIGDEEIGQTILMTQSPIERLFYVSLRRELALGGINVGDGFNDLTPQQKVSAGAKNYYIDFSLSRFDGTDKVVELFIELDGHKYHNESKKKVAEDRKRERAVQGSCDKLITFTGSEIFNDPGECARETIKIFNRLLKMNGVL